MSSDADSYFSLQVDPDYVQFVGQKIDRPRFDRLFERLIEENPDQLSLAICGATEGTVYGEAVLVPSSPGEVEMVISIAREHRRQGYAIEAAREVALACLRTDGIDSVMVCVEDENAPSLCLVKRLGMERVGRTERSGDKNPTVFVLKRRPADNTTADEGLTL